MTWLNGNGVDNDVSTDVANLLRMLIRGLVVWVVLIAAEFVHGIARAIWLVPLVGDWRSRQIGVLTGSLINLTITTMFVGWMQPTRETTALLIGTMWLVLTVTFELVFGRVVMQASWHRIASDYDLTHGGFLPLGLLLLAFAPLLMAKLRHVF